MTEMLIIPASILAVLAACVGIVALSNYLGNVGAARVMEAEKSKAPVKRRNSPRR